MKKFFKSPVVRNIIVVILLVVLACIATFIGSLAKKATLPVVIAFAAGMIVSGVIEMVMNHHHSNDNSETTGGPSNSNTGNPAGSRGTRV